MTSNHVDLLRSHPVLPPWVVILDGDLVRRARREAGLSQERLAYKSGVSITTVGRLERESRPAVTSGPAT
jgi:DNA-binding transcriptional regulator YiaG